MGESDNVMDTHDFLWTKRLNICTIIMVNLKLLSSYCLHIYNITLPYGAIAYLHQIWMN